MSSTAKRSLPARAIPVVGALLLAVGLVVVGAKPALADGDPYTLVYTFVRNNVQPAVSGSYSKGVATTANTITKSDLEAAIGASSLTDENKQYFKDNLPASFTSYNYPKETTATPETIFAAADKSIEVKAEVQDTKYPVVATAATGGTAKINVASQDGRYDRSAVLNLTATPNDGYTFKQWSYSVKTWKDGNTDITHQAYFDVAANKTATFTLPNKCPSVNYKSTEYQYTIQAEFEPINYTVEFHANNGTGSMADQSFTYGVEQKLAKSSMTRSGHKFAGWNTKADGSGEAYGDEESVKNLTTEAGGTVTLYAQWSEAYSITPKPNPDIGGTVNVSPEDAAEDDTVTITATPAEHYIFTSWDVKDVDGKAIEVTPLVAAQADPSDMRSVYGMFTMPKGNVTAGAVFTSAYTVKFDANGGTGTMDDQEFAMDAEQKLTKNAFSRTGYTFDGWATQKDGSGTKYTDEESVKGLATTVGETVTLYAQWTQIPTFTVSATVDPTAGGTATIDKSSAAEGDTIALKATANAGYTFSSWAATTSSGTVKITDSKKEEASFTMPAGDVTVTATFKAELYKVAITTPTGGKVTADKKSAIVGDTVTLTATPTTSKVKESYVFSSWDVKDASGNAITVSPLVAAQAEASDTSSVTGTFTMPASDVTVTANFKVADPVMYTITFNGNGGTGTMNPQSVEEGVATALSTNTFTRAGYKFAGWNTSADGQGTSYKDGAKVTPTADITLYAQWTASRVTATAPTMSNSKGGAFAERTDEITYTIRQVIPEGAKSAHIYVDLDNALYYTVDANGITVQAQGASNLSGQKSIDGQRLNVVIDDATGLAGKTVVITYKAKLRGDANLDPYLNSAKNTASVPYQAHTKFTFTDGTETTVHSTSESVKFRTTSSTSTANTATKANSTTPKTGDASLVGAALAAGAAGATALAGGVIRRRRK